MVHHYILIIWLAMYYKFFERGREVIHSIKDVQSEIEGCERWRQIVKGIVEDGRSKS